MRNPEKRREEIGGQDEAGAEEFELSESYEGEEVEKTSEEIDRKKEIKYGQDDEGKNEEAKRRLGEIFDSHKDGQERIEEIISIIEPFLKSDLIDGKEVQHSLEECSTINEKEEFIKKILSSLGPIIELRKKNPEAFKEIQKQEKFIDLGEILSYGLSEDKKLIHIHLVEVEEKVKGRVTRDRLKKDLKQLAKMIGESEQFKEVKTITATSWIVAKYPKATEGFGFTLEGEISLEERQEHFPGEFIDIDKEEVGGQDEASAEEFMATSRPGKPINKASMTREEFLKRYLEK